MEKVKYKLSDFSYELPEELIAQHPVEQRDSCKLMALNRESGELSHHVFTDVENYLREGDCLVLNDTKVFPARLFGMKDKTGAKVEIFLLRNLEGNVWEVLVKPARKVRIGNKVTFSDEMSCDVIDNTLSGGRIVEFNCNGDFFDLLADVGKTPLPPYIKREVEDSDKDDYQTVYAKNNGAVAAPTAGLHFTDELLTRLKNKGVNIAYVTLHAGLGTFRPVQVEDITRHRMDSEYYEIQAEAASLINDTRQNQGRVIAVGTTSVRILETVADQRGFLRPARGWTDKFIYPSYEFKIINGLITNFHLPSSTLLMLVSAFSSVEMVKDAYKAAVEKKYRFFSYGDAMIIS